MEIPGHPRAVSAVRAWVLAVVGPDSPHAYALELIASELATNAVVHGRDGGRIRVRLEVWPGGDVKLSVMDEGPRARREPSEEELERLANNGRGLAIVEELAAAFAQVVTDQGRRTWALIA